MELYDYRDVYTLVSGAIAITGAVDNDNAKRTNERNKGVIFTNCAPFTNFFSSINNIQIDNGECIDFVMSVHNLIEYSDNYLKTSGSLWQYYWGDPNDNIIQSESFKFKIEITGKTPATVNTKDVKIAVPLRHLGNFRRKITLEILLIDCVISLGLTWSKKCVIPSAVGITKFKITDTKLYQLKIM